MALLPYDLRQNPASGVDEPVADLEDGQPGLFGKGELLGVTGVGVVSVFVEPVSEDKYGFLGQVSSPLPGNAWPGPQSRLLTTGVLVSTGGAVARHSTVNHRSDRADFPPFGKISVWVYVLSGNCTVW